MTTYSKRSLYLASLILVLFPFLNASEYSYFEKNIRPLFVKHCYECHSGTNPDADLRLDYKGGLLSGGKKGSVLNLLKPEASLILKAVQGQDMKKMPKGGPYLSDLEIEHLETWVKSGAPDPRNDIPDPQNAKRRAWLSKLDERKQHWSWQPIAVQQVPDISNEEWNQNFVDRYIKNKLDQKQLSPNPKADRRVMIRRLKTLLNGLPPTREEIENFLNDTSSRAIEKLVDQFLASPAFGEHWARSWLDLVRYADTAGYQRDLPIPNSHEYRNYIIRAFNDNLPYDQWVKEHIAGDLIPPRYSYSSERNEAPIGTGFFRLMEVESTASNLPLVEATIIENQIDTLGKVFQGQTFGCARCHNHKFDAISQADYYALYGILSSSRMHQLTVSDLREISAQVNEMKVIKNKIKHDLVETWINQFKSLDVLIHPEWKKLLSREIITPHDPLYLLSKVPLKEAQKQQVTFSKNRQYNEKNYNTLIDFRFDHDWSIHAYENFRSINDWSVSHLPSNIIDRFHYEGFSTDSLSKKLGATIRSPNFKLEAENISFLIAGDITSHAKLVQHNFTHLENVAQGQKVEHVQDTNLHWVTMKSGHQESWKGLRSYLEIVTKDEAAHFRRADKSSKPYKAAKNNKDGRSWFNLQKIVSHKSSQPPLTEGDLESVFMTSENSQAAWINNIPKRCILALNRWKENKANHADILLLNWLLKNQLIKNNLKNFPLTVQNSIQKYKNLERRLSIPVRSPGLIDDAQGFDVALQYRGDPDKPGDLIPRRYLEVLGSQVYKTSKSGRMELALEISSPNNPLTARVMVNRIWSWVFGRGIVKSVDYFGSTAEPPTHPALLDHLAHHFIQSGWDIKKLVRMLVLTRTFQCTSQVQMANHRIDPNNIYLSRSTVKRLRAESIRDSLLFIAQQLDTSETTKAFFKVDYKKAIYHRIKRNKLDHMMQMFDRPEPAFSQGERESTNVPGQALLFMNNPLVHKQAELWARYVVLHEAPLSMDHRISGMFEQVTGRTPDRDEIAMLLEFAEQQIEFLQVENNDISTNEDLWIQITHLLFGLKEFIYIL